ncbi:MAG: alpha-amylase family protein [Bacteroidales bacterium]|nr:alpha-amylase family protein [Bacteroidales bacterium]
MANKFIIYQLLLRVFGNTNTNCVSNGSYILNGSGKFSDINESVFSYLKTLNITHIWYTGVIEHATKSDFSEFGIVKDNPNIVKGEAGSPYAIKDYYDVNPYLADNPNNRREEFDSLVERTHNAGFKVIIDFVPNHLARVYNSDSAPLDTEDFGIHDKLGSFSPDNNFYYIPGTKYINGDYIEKPAKASGNDCFSASPSVNDWYETVKLNYGVDYMNGCTKHFNPIPDTWTKMYNILRFWCQKGVDGFRCDMAEMVPVEFWEWSLSKIKSEFPDVIFIAEVYNPNLYSSYINTGKFDLLYDKVGLYDTLKFVSQGNISSSCITGCWQSLGDLQPNMLNFLENHDEQRVASDFNLSDPFKSIPELVVSLMLNKSPFMIYFGQEVGEKGMLSEGFSGVDGRTSIFDYCSAPSVVRLLKNNLSKDERELLDVYKELLDFAIKTPAIYQGDTFDLQYANYNNPYFNSDKCFVFARKDAQTNETYVIAVDFSQSYKEAKINLPDHFFRYWEIPYGEYNPFSQVPVTFNKFGVSIFRIF